MSIRATGSFESRKGAQWSRDYADYRSRREASRSVHLGASVQESVTPPSVEAMQAAVESQTCPFCGAGPYKSLGLHTNKAHGVSAAELRDMAQVEKVCSSELTKGSRERLIARPDRDEITSRGGRESMRIQKASGRKLGNPDMTAVLAASLAPRKSRAEARNPELIRRATSGDELLQDVARDLGVTPEHARRIVKAHGLTPSHDAVNAMRRKRLDDFRAAASASNVERYEEIERARLARFVELGGDWSALTILADELGLSRKQTRDYLAKHRVVLDGRKVRHLAPRTQQSPSTQARLANQGASA